jgi:hypothetical protein
MPDTTVQKSAAAGRRAESGAPQSANDLGHGGTLLPIAEPPFILGSRAAFSVWSAALALSHSLYS